MMRFKIFHFRFLIADSGMRSECPAAAPQSKILNSKSKIASPGFTLIEVLIAMGIFLIGVICVAALFPASVAVQRDTIESLMGQQVSRRAIEQMRAIASSGVDRTDPLTYHHDANEAARRGTLAGYTYDPGNPGNRLDLTEAAYGDPRRVLPLLDYKNITNLPNINADARDTNNYGGSGQSGYLPDAPVSNFIALNREGFRNIFGRDLTSYPSTNEYLYRDYFWFPFINHNGDLTDSNATILWSGYVIVMHRQPQMNVPQIRYTNATEDFTDVSRIKFDSAFDNDADHDGTPDLIKPGDFLLADNGLIHRVILADADGCTVDSPVLQAGDLTLERIYFVVDVDAEGKVKREGPSPVAWIEGPFSLPVQDPGP